jgi:hypothetical protein
MWVGKEYTMKSFVEESQERGTSKRIPNIPKDFVVGRDWVFLARYNGGKTAVSRIVDGRETRMVDVIFYAYRPTAVEIVLTKSQAENQEYVYRLREQGLTPVLEHDRPLIDTKRLREALKTGAEGLKESEKVSKSSPRRKRGKKKKDV